MGVVDHPVHERTRKKYGEKYGCHSINASTARMDGYFAPCRVYAEDGTFITTLVFIEHRMSVPCRSFYLWDTDQECSGCTKPKDTAYAEQMKDLK